MSSIFSSRRDKSPIRFVFCFASSCRNESSFSFEMLLKTDPAPSMIASREFSSTAARTERLDAVGRHLSTLGDDGCALLVRLHCTYDEAVSGASVDRPVLHARVLAHQARQQVGHVQLLGLATGTVPRGAPMNFVVPTLRNWDTDVGKGNTIAIFSRYRRGLALSTGRRIADTVFSLITDNTVRPIIDSTVTRNISYIFVAYITVFVLTLCCAPNAGVCSEA